VSSEVGAHQASGDDGSADADADSYTEILVPGPAHGLAGLLDIEPPRDTLPPGWHQVYLLERRAHAELGDDGHPASGIPQPPEPGNLRMFAGGRITEYAALTFDVPATRTTKLVGSVEKQGRSSKLTFVTIRHTIHQGGRVALIEEQDLVYRAATATLPQRPAGEAVPATPDCLQLQVDNALLFRFSALTYNAHRIHYDQAYAAAEGYPDLVVHGPLQSLLLRELFRRAGAPSTGHQFTYRLVSPVYGNLMLTVRPVPGEAPWNAQVEGPGGHISATATLAPAPEARA
jgi:3-methylfumaryl-CoA hydratase